VARWTTHGFGRTHKRRRRTRGVGRTRERLENAPGVVGAYASRSGACNSRSSCVGVSRLAAPRVR
jgi:hypothetical protein